MARNRYKVPKKQWKKWCELSQRVFNRVYAQLKEQGEQLAPGLHLLSIRQIRVLAWNAAWLAASDTEDSLRDMAKGR